MLFSIGTLETPAVTPAASVVRITSVRVASKGLHAGIIFGWLLLLRSRGS